MVPHLGGRFPRQQGTHRRNYLGELPIGRVAVARRTRNQTHTIFYHFYSNRDLEIKLILVNYNQMCVFLLKSRLRLEKINSDISYRETKHTMNKITSNSNGCLGTALNANWQPWIVLYYHFGD